MSFSFRQHPANSLLDCYIDNRFPIFNLMNGRGRSLEATEVAIDFNGRRNLTSLSVDSFRAQLRSGRHFSGRLAFSIAVLSVRPPKSAVWGLCNRPPIFGSHTSSGVWTAKPFLFSPATIPLGRPLSTCLLKVSTRTPSRMPTPFRFAKSVT